MKALVWSAGNGGLMSLDMLALGLEIVAFIDKDEQKIGSKLAGINILSPSDISSCDFDVVAVANENGIEIIRELIEVHSIAPEKIIDIFNQGFFNSRVGTLRAISREIQEAGTEGSVAELGVFKGDFAQYINILFPGRRLYLFDTFSGFAPQDIKVEHDDSLSNSSEGEYSNQDVGLVMAKMRNPENCIIKKGVFPESAENVEDSFCFVSLDVDLYLPTLEGLKFFFPKLTRGGYIMVHDYHSPRFLGVKKAVKEFCTVNKLSPVPLMDSCGSVVIVK